MRMAIWQSGTDRPEPSTIDGRVQLLTPKRRSDVATAASDASAVSIR
jgi:hypothetical protein